MTTYNVKWQKGAQAQFIFEMDVKVTCFPSLDP